MGKMIRIEHSALRQAQGEPGEVKSEYSAGGCVYRQWTANSGQRTVKWLLGKHSGYHKWVLPKGLIEAGETAMETAVREVKEEMGVEARVIGTEPVWVEKYVYWADLKQMTNEQPRRRVEKYQESGGGKTKIAKTVDFYLMEWVAGDPKDHDWEMEEAGWFGFEEAFKKLSFEGERAALKTAQQIISSEV